MEHQKNSRIFDRTTPPHIFTLILLTGISAMSMSIFLPSLPSMMVDLKTEYSIIQLSVSLYLAFTALVQFIIGPLSDRFGRRPTALWSISVFIFASIGCYFATSIEVFLAFRMMQAFVAIGQVISRAVVRDIFSQDEAASKIGYVTMGMALVPMFAPMIGGMLDGMFGWRSTFIFMTAFGFLLLIIIWFDQGETATSNGKNLFQQFQEYPELFASRRFWGYVLAATFSAGTFFAFLGGAPYVATNVFELSSSQTGLLFGIPATGYLVGNLLTGIFSKRLGINPMILVGASLLTLGMASSLILTLMGYESPLVFFGFCILVGLGNGLTLPNATAGMLSVRPKIAGTASGIGGAIMIGGGAALSALAGALLERGNGSYPLQLIMLTSAVLCLISILYVIQRAKAITET